MKAEIGIFGGSGFYKILERAKEVEIKTPYGKPSDKISLFSYQGKKIAFLPRHGKNHQFPPHKIPYLANLWAFKKLGVKQIIAPAAAGSLQSEIKPGDFVICDQFVDRTKNRKDTFFPGPKIVHISSVEPYCKRLRKLAFKICQDLKIPVHKKGTLVVIEGPRFSSKAESSWFTKMGWQVINMTGYPEVILAKELEMCYVNISLITDYDAGLVAKKKVKPVSLKEVIRIFNQNNEKLRKVIFKILEKISLKRNCPCPQALKEAQF
jgi:5'-methylthioadenosine phosphorylase